MSFSHPVPPRPSRVQIAAAISVLGEGHASLHRSARGLLTAFGDCAIPLLLQSAEAEHKPTRIRCRAILREIALEKLRHRFARLDFGLVGRPSVLVLLEGAILSAQMVDFFLQSHTANLRDVISRHASALGRVCVGEGSPRCVELLRDCIHSKMGLRGVACEPLTTDHVLLHKVIENRVGTPLALALIYVMVARSAGLLATVVKLPDHFLVRIDSACPIIVDPLLGGRVLTKADCVRAWGVGCSLDITDREVLLEYMDSIWQQVPSEASRSGGDSSSAPITKSSES